MSSERADAKKKAPGFGIVIRGSVAGPVSVNATSLPCSEQKRL